MSHVFVNNPDGSAAVLTPEYSQSRQNPPPPTDPVFKIQRNPFPEHDQVASENLERMKNQDYAAWKEHSPAEPVRMDKKVFLCSRWLIYALFIKFNALIGV